MIYRNVYSLFIALLAAAVSAGAEPNTARQSAWIDLFNGVDLSGFEIYGKDESRRDENSLPLEDIFVVRDGVIHVYPEAPDGSMQGRAIIRTSEEFSRYRLQIEYRWLGSRFIPREDANRDAGILLHCHTRTDVVWPASIEMQMGEGRPGEPYVSGDLWVIGNSRALSPERKGMYHPDGERAYKYGIKSMPRKNLTSIYAENPVGEWNLAEAVVDGANSMQFILNGKLINEVLNPEYLDYNEWKPLEKGYVAFQAEWAEYEIRSIRIQLMGE